MSQADLDLCARRYIEEQAAPSFIGWRELAYFAALRADAIQKADPYSETGQAVRGISDMAWRRSVNMLPQREESDLSQSAGVMCGWFPGSAA